MKTQRKEDIHSLLRPAVGWSLWVCDTAKQQHIFHLFVCLFPTKTYFFCHMLRPSAAFSLTGISRFVVMPASPWHCQLAVDLLTYIAAQQISFSVSLLWSLVSLLLSLNCQLWEMTANVHLLILCSCVKSFIINHTCQNTVCSDSKWLIHSLYQTLSKSDIVEPASDRTETSALTQLQDWWRKIK